VSETDSDEKTYGRENTMKATDRFKEVIETRARRKYGIVHMKQKKRLYSAKKPIGDLTKGDLWLRDFNPISLANRCRSLEDKFDNSMPIYEVLEVHTTGEVFRSYFEIHLTPKFDWSKTRDGRERTNF